MRVGVRVQDVLDIVCRLAEAVQVQQGRCAQLSQGGLVRCCLRLGARRGDGDLVQRAESACLDISNGLLQDAGQRWPAWLPAGDGVKLVNCVVGLERCRKSAAPWHPDPPTGRSTRPPRERRWFPGSSVSPLDVAPAAAHVRCQVRPDGRRSPRQPPRGRSAPAPGGTVVPRGCRAAPARSW